MKVIGFVMAPRKSAKKRKPQQGWHAEQIKAEIRMRGMTLTQLSLDAGLGEGTCRAALQRCQPKGDLAISRFLGVSLHELWPDRYDSEGMRIHHVRDETTAKPKAAHRLSAQVA
jgi:Ner family transcriptional regulator